jgi:hypothetical protein
MSLIKRTADVTVIVGNVVGAFLIAVGDARIAMFGYAFFIAGCVASIYLLRQSTASKSLTYITYYFLAVNFLGIAKRMI